MKSYKFNIEGKAYEVTINKAQNGVVDMNVNDKNFVVEIEKEKPVVTPPAPAPRPQLIEPKPTVTHKVSTENQPLTIMKIYVATGQTVKKGDKLFTMISDGKECDITADKDGQVERINVVVGQNIPSEGASIELKNCGQSTTSQNFSTENATPAPLPGTIVQIVLPEGSPVKAGDLVLTMDSMKMVNNVLAEKSGIIKHMIVQERQAVLEGDPLFIIE